jgi:hypothetical protein
MKNLIASVFFFSLLIISCSDKNKVPKGILRQDQMQSVMWDMIRTGEFLNGYIFPRDTSINQVIESQEWHKRVFDLHKTNKEQFERSYAYYKKHPALMRVLLDSLSNKKYIADTIKTVKPDTARPPRPDSPPTRRPDSIRKRILKPVDIR